ncbi:MAG TPA: hypothetical protein VLA21_07955 [Candidatus Limnocylindria bacterium]|nr:hypothetical protein [Candidatus Limnocylindria bacterium]
MRRTILWTVILALLAALVPAGAAPASLAQALPAALTRLETGGATGPCVALAERDGVAAQIRLSTPDGDDAVLELADVKSGALLASRPLPGGMVPYGARMRFLDGGGLALADMDSVRVWVLDAALRETRSFAPPDPGAWFSAYVDGGGEHAYFGGARGVARYRLSDGAEEDPGGIVPEGWTFAHFAGEADGGVLCVYSGRDDLSLLLHALPRGKAILYTVPAGFGACADGILAAEAMGEMFLLPLPGSLLYRFRAPGSGEYPGAARGTEILLQSFGEPGAFRVVDLASSRVLAELTLPGLGGGYWCEAAALGDGFALLALGQSDGGAGGLYRWDFSGPSGSRDAGVSKVTLAELRLENDARAAAITARHGVGVLLREAGAAFRDDAYQGEPSRDEVRLGGALAQLEAFLDALPPGMAARAAAAQASRIDVYLSGRITPRGASSISSAAGFVTRASGAAGIVLSSFGPGMTQLLAHEFMHVLEDGLQLDSAGDGKWPPVTYWERPAPEDGQGGMFAYSYHNPDGTEYGDTRWTLGAEEDPQDVWFLDGYSRTYPLEDRARVFENLYVAKDGTEAVFAYPHLLQKARALCAMLRRAFPEIEAAGGAPWERFLVPMGDGELTEYLRVEEGDVEPAGFCAYLPAASTR